MKVINFIEKEISNANGDFIIRRFEGARKTTIKVYKRRDDNYFGLISDDTYWNKDLEKEGATQLC